MLSLDRFFYFYSQSLDNSGDTEYWRCSGSKVFERLCSGDYLLSKIRVCIDEVMVNGEELYSEGSFFKCLIDKSGRIAVAVVYPDVLDADGRRSPVLVVFDPLGLQRRFFFEVVSNIPEVTGRKLGLEALNGASELSKQLNGCWTVLFLKIFIKNFLRRLK